MNREESIRNALRQIATENIPDHSNLWPQILPQLSQGSRAHFRRPLRWSWTVLLVVLGLISATGAAYAYYHWMIDPGLQSAENAGLVTHLEQTAEPTVFPAVSSSPIPAASKTTSPQQVAVALNWAYADERRIAWQLTLTGLVIPPGATLRDLVCSPQISNDAGVKILPSLSDISLQDQPGSPIELTYTAYPHLDASQHNSLNMTLDLTLGPCSPYWNFQETNLPKPPPIPLIGTYHLAFQVPVYPGVTRTLDQTVVANGIPMRLEKITFNRSYTDVRLCYSTSSRSDLTGWTPTEATLQVGDSPPVMMDAYLEPSPGGFQEDCYLLGFASAVDSQLAGNILITIPQLTAVQGADAFLDPKVQDAAQPKLSVLGIVVVFQPSGNRYWQILQKPAGMTDDQADQIVLGLLDHSLKGPWVFHLDAQAR